MADTREWENTAGANDKGVIPDFPKEGWSSEEVNDWGREHHAALRRMLEALPWLQLVQAADNVTRVNDDQVQITGADYTGIFSVGDRVRVGLTGTLVEREISSVVFGGGNTTITFATGELAAGIDLTFADADPDTILAASGTPFSGLGSGDQVRVEGSASNDSTYRLFSATSTLLTLEAAEVLTDEGPVAAQIYLFDTHFPIAAVPAGTNLIELFVGSSKEAAHRLVGTATGEIPLIDDLGDGALLDQGADGGFDAATVGGKSYPNIQAYAEALQGNLIVNPEFRFWQPLGPVPAAQNDLVYVCDQWKLLAETDLCVTLTRTTSSAELPFGAFAGIKAVQAIADSKWALYQMFEARDTRGMRGRPLSLSFSARLQTGDASPATLRFAFIEWTGAEDAPTADPVTTWNAAGVNPTLAANFAYIGAEGSQTTFAGARVQCTLENRTPSGNAANVGVLIWTDDDTIAATDEIVLTGVEVTFGVQRYSEHPFVSDEEQLRRCWRYYWKTFALDTAPAFGAPIDGSLSGFNSGSDDIHFHERFPVRMHSTPTVTLYGPTPATTEVTANIDGSSANLLNSEVDVSTPEAIDVYDLTAAAPAANAHHRTHIRADATFF